LTLFMFVGYTAISILPFFHYIYDTPLPFVLLLFISDILPTIVVLFHLLLFDTITFPHCSHSTYICSCLLFIHCSRYAMLNAIHLPIHSTYVTISLPLDYVDSISIVDFMFTYVIPFVRHSCYYVSVFHSLTCLFLLFIICYRFAAVLCSFHVLLFPTYHFLIPALHYHLFLPTAIPPTIVVACSRCGRIVTDLPYVIPVALFRSRPFCCSFFYTVVLPLYL